MARFAPKGSAAPIGPIATIDTRKDRRGNQIATRSHRSSGFQLRFMRGTAGRVPAHKGPPVPRGLRPHPSGSRACPAGPSSLGLSAGLFAHSASPPAPGPLPLRGSAPARRGRRRFAGPVRGIAAALRLPGPPLGPRPPAPPLGRSARLRASSGSRWPRAPCRPIRAAVGSLFASPLLCSGSAVGLPWPRRGPLRAARFAASGAAGSVARGGGPFASLRALLRRAPRSGSAPAPARAWLASRWCCGGRGVLPCAPPPRRPRWGLRGARCPFGWLRPPLRGPRFSRPSRGPPSRSARARRGISARLTFLKIVNRGSARRRERPFYPARQGFPSAVPLWISACSLLRSGFPPFARSLCWWPKSAAKPGLDLAGAGNLPGGLDFPGRWCYIGMALPVPLLRGPPLPGCPWTA